MRSGTGAGLLGVFVALGLLVPGPGVESAEGGDILTPFAVSASSNYSENPPIRLIDGSGLTGTGLTATHTNGYSANIMWMSSSGTVSTNWVTFDLGEGRDVLKALIWQFNQTKAADLTSRGLKTYTIQVAGADQVFSDFAVSNTLIKAGGTSAEPVQVVPLVASNVRYVKFKVHENYGASGFVGLSEVRFETVPAKTNGILVTPTGGSASSTYPGYVFANMINSSGLRGDGISATHTNGGVTLWHAATGAQPTNQWVEFDLGKERRLLSAVIWNANQNPGSDLSTRGVKEFTIETAGNGKSYTRHAQRFLSKAGGTTAEPAQIVRLEADNVRWVKFKVDQTWGASEYVGLSEVRFIYTLRKGTMISVR